MQSGCLGKGSVPIGDGLDACQEIEGLLILPLAGCSALVQLVPRLTAGCSALLPAPSLGPPMPGAHRASCLRAVHRHHRSHNNANSHSRAQESCLEARQPYQLQCLFKRFKSFPHLPQQAWNLTQHTRPAARRL